MPDALVLGAGPAGLAAASSLTRRGRPVTVLEKAPGVGGLARTVQWKGYRFDVGGHRFFTRSDRVQRLWEETLGDQLLVRPRLSRILYRGRLFDYPLRPANALQLLGPVEAARCVASFGRARLRRGPADSFEDWVVQRFGRRLFEIFFRTYTEKVWGLPCDQISADWAAQRIKNLSLGRALRHAIRPDRSVTSLVESFHYPRLGPGQMYDALADRVRSDGGVIHLEDAVVAIHHADGRVRGVTTASGRRFDGDAVFSSIPLTVLIEQMDPPAPAAVRAAARSLRFRHLLAVNLIVEGDRLFDDTWVYVHSPELRVGRIQNYGNWSPHMVAEPGRSALGLEYFTEDGGDLWRRSDAELVGLATEELARTGLCAPQVLDGMVVRAPRAYPVYAQGYEGALQTMIPWLQGIAGLHPIGRYGMFKYNNSDHSILTAMLAVENHLDGAGHDVWAVNADEQYVEERPSAG